VAAGPACRQRRARETRCATRATPSHTVVLSVIATRLSLATTPPVSRVATNVKRTPPWTVATALAAQQAHGRSHHRPRATPAPIAPAASLVS